MRPPDWLVDQLPVGKTEDEFLVRFLSIFQDVADTVVHQVDTLPHMFDPAVAPDAIVRLMGTWIGIDWIDPALPDRMQRRIVTEYADLLRWRGTARGLRLLLELITDGPATVTDNGGIYEAGGAPRMAPHVRLEVSRTGFVAETLVEEPGREPRLELVPRSEQDLVRIIRSEVPAWVTFQLLVGGRTVWPPTPADPGEATAELQEVS
jgi:phage tail-like protein